MLITECEVGYQVAVSSVNPALICSRNAFGEKLRFSKTRVPVNHTLIRLLRGYLFISVLFTTRTGMCYKCCHHNPLGDVDAITHAPTSLVILLPYMEFFGDFKQDGLPIAICARGLVPAQLYGSG